MPLPATSKEGLPSDDFASCKAGGEGTGFSQSMDLEMQPRIRRDYADRSNDRND